MAPPGPEEGDAIAEEAGQRLEVPGQGGHGEEDGHALGADMQVSLQEVLERQLDDGWLRERGGEHAGSD
jgi:hypothetical protein